MEVDENSEKELETAGWKGSVELLTPLGFPMRGPQWVTGGCQLDRSETTTTETAAEAAGAAAVPAAAAAAAAAALAAALVGKRQRLLTTGTK